MIAVEEAVARIVGAFHATARERIPVGEAAGRVLAEDAVARMDQPPEPVSSMDGYAVRAADAAESGQRNRFVVFQRKARDEEQMFRTIMRQLGFPLEDEKKK